MDQGVIESVKRRYKRKLLATLFGEDGENTSVIDLLKKVNIKVVVYMIAESWSELLETTLVKSWRKILPSSQAAEDEVVSTDTESTDDFLSALKLSKDVKMSMQKTSSNGWLLTKIYSKRLYQMRILSLPSQQMEFKTKMMMMKTTLLKMHPS
ncbi:hypothetical protein JTE90_016747 [Oedothorax gibbosus]|uniref:DDE-1 domain-containing protein n=1 Tax=Oedothorax gibbosus TaxID=931172 RepID=A0AAV6VYX7_9ARAC|nr:hypothetical protein JTE90_016747 [Oedothorax gibbosus]